MRYYLINISIFLLAFQDIECQNLSPQEHMHSFLLNNNYFYGLDSSDNTFNLFQYQIILNNKLTIYSFRINYSHINRTFLLINENNKYTILGQKDLESDIIYLFNLFSKFDISDKKALECYNSLIGNNKKK